MEEPNVIVQAITSFTGVWNAIITTITGSAVLMTMFAGCLFLVGAKVFKKIKNSVK